MSTLESNDPVVDTNFRRKYGRKDRTNWGLMDMPPDPPVVLRRLADQINWFNRRSQQNQTKYKVLKGAIYFAAAAVTLTPVLDQFRYQFTTVTAALLGAAIIFLQNLLSMNNCRGNWLSYRRTCEELKRQKYLYLSRAESYADSEEPEVLLASRIETILVDERDEWLTIRSREEHDSAGSTLPPPNRSSQ